MSTIIADNLTGKTSAGDITVTSEGGAATQSLQQGLAKAWVNFDGTGTIASRDSLNVGSLTDNGTGDYTITLSSAMNNVNYCVTGGTGYAYANSGARDSNCQPYDLTTSLFDLSVGLSTTAAARDHGIVTASAHGDLA